MKIHYLVFDTERGISGECVGSTAGANLQVQFPGEIQSEIKIGNRYKKVLQESIEYLALKDREACLKLFTESPDAFFSKLINYRYYINPLNRTLTREKIVEIKKDSIGIRGQVRDSSGQLLFPELKFFSNGLDKAIENWQKKKSIEVQVEGDKKSNLIFRPLLDIEISEIGSIPLISKYTFETVSEADEETRREWFEDFKPSKGNHFQKLIKNIYQNKEIDFSKINFNSIEDSAETLRNQLGVKWLENTLNQATNETRNTSILAIAFAIKIRNGIRSGPGSLINEVFFEDLVKLTRTVCKHSKRNIWGTQLALILISSGYQLDLPQDLPILQHLIIAKSRDGEPGENKFLRDYVGFLNLGFGDNFLSQIETTTVQVLSATSASFSNDHVMLLKAAKDLIKMSIRNSLFYTGLTINRILTDSSLRFLWIDAELVDMVVKPRFTALMNTDIEISNEEIAGILLDFGAIYKNLDRWDLLGKFNKVISKKYLEEPKLRSIFVPSEIDIKVSSLEIESTQIQAELHESRKHTKSQAINIEKLEKEVEFLKNRLEATMASNNELLEAKTLNEVFSTARLFAEVCRVVRLSDETKGNKKLQEELNHKLSKANIFPLFETGQVVLFNQDRMDYLDKKPGKDQPVIVVDPVFELRLPNQTFLLTKALIRSNMETAL